MADEHTPSPEDQARLREIVSHYPQEIHFIGGPYCGAILEPHNELIHDVHRRDFKDHWNVPVQDLPSNFFPVDVDRLVLAGPSGMALYVLDELERRWSFREMVDAD